MALPSNTKRKIFDGRYEVLSIVGRGIDSVVYHARHVSGSNQEVALKVLLNHKNPTLLSERLRKEALTLVSCRHKYVVRLDDFHSVDNLCYLSMEYASDGDLRKVLSSLGTHLSSTRGARYLQQCLEALDFIHATGVVHRDIKLDNILVISEQEIRLADFGLALLPGDEVELDELKAGVGSLSYLPPELLDGTAYDERSDLYSLGLCFYEALAGFHPFDKLSLAEQLHARDDGAIAPLHDVHPGFPRHLSDVIAKLIRYNSTDRFQTALEAARALGNHDFRTEESIQVAVAANAGDSSISNDDQKRSEPATPDIFEVSHTATEQDYDLLSDDTPEEPLQTAAPYKTGERIPQLTEEIDLARIKEILANDSQQKTERATRKATHTRTIPGTPDPSSPPKQERYALEPKPRTQNEQRLPAPLQAPHSNLQSIKRLVGVGFAAALLTISLIVIVEHAPGFSLDSITTLFSHFQSADSNEEPTPALVREESPFQADSSLGISADATFPLVPGGLYSGAIEGIIPGIRSPLTLLSLPTKGQVAVIVGIEGWSPSMSSSKVEEGAPENTLVIRTNGVILNLTGVLSSDTITGTFVNALTGEAGTWSVKQVS